MIQPNQLRLGNYLLNTSCREGGTIAKVALIDNHHVGCVLEGVKVDLCYEFTCYEPISLTGKILQDLSVDQSLKIGSNSEGFFYYTSNGRFVKLNYLHQLQNLYFTITGEELPVNLENISVETALASTTA